MDLGAAVLQRPGVHDAAERFDTIVLDPPAFAKNKAAVANAKLAYQLFLERFSGPRWEALAARGVALDDTEVDRHTRYTVGLFLRGVMPRDRKSTAQKEIQQVMNSIAEALALLDEARERLNQLEKLN